MNLDDFQCYDTKLAEKALALLDEVAHDMSKIKKVTDELLALKDQLAEKALECPVMKEHKTKLTERNKILRTRKIINGDTLT